MISYARLFKMLKERNITTVIMINEWGVSSESLMRLRRDESVSVKTLDKLCENLNCELEDIAEYIPNSDDETMAYRIALVMNKRGWTANQLAVKAGVNRQSISVYLRGISEPRKENLEKIAKALGASTYWLKGERY